MQLRHATELTDEAMVAARCAEAQREEAEGQLAAAAHEKVAALVKLAELSRLLSERRNAQLTLVRPACVGTGCSVRLEGACEQAGDAIGRHVCEWEQRG